MELCRRRHLGRALNVTTDGPLTVTLAKCRGKSKSVTASFG
jgi:hypothetical protein